jgi:hypothetical protein
LLSTEQQKFLDEAQKNGKLDAMLAAMKEGHPNKSIQITGGFVAGDKAVLLIVGEGSIVRLRGEALMLKEGGTWRVDDEMTAAD